VITWQNPQSGEFLYYHPNNGGQTLWTAEREEARIFRDRASVERSLTWLRQLGIQPKVESIRIREIIAPASPAKGKGG